MSDLIVIPTYCERTTLPRVTTLLHEASPSTTILVVDDNSPDGTGEWAQQMSNKHTWFNSLHRPVKRGLGSAYLDGFRWGLAHGFDVLAQMDADGSHLPGEYPRLKARLQMPDQPDLVIGSRWVPGGQSGQWSKLRRFLSVAGNHYWRAMTGLQIGDITSGFRAYRSAGLENILCQINQRGFGFQADMTINMATAQRCIVEVPIRFVDRLEGKSKIDASAAWEQLTAATCTGIQRVML